MGENAESEATWRAEKWHAWANAESGYIPWSNRQTETTCFTGRGETYAGNAAITKNGHACKAGTFCRNPDPANQFIPYCQQERDNAYVACQITGCGQEPPKYSGNRGISAALQKKWAPDYYDYGRVSPAYFQDAARNWIHPAFFMSGGKDQFFYSQDSAADSYMIQAKNYFIAPMDGVYSFNVIGDDRVALKTDFSDQDGSYEHDARLLWATNVDSRQDRSNESGGKRRTLQKGEKVYMETLMTEWGGNDRLIVGVVYHGKTETSGTWVDNRVKKHFPQDQYAYDIQRLWFDTDGRHEQTWITMRVDREDLEAGNGIGPGETFDRTLGLQFKLQQCGDNGQCFQTENIDTRNWNSNQVEAEIKVRLSSFIFVLFTTTNLFNFFSLFITQKPQTNHEFKRVQNNTSR